MGHRTKLKTVVDRVLKENGEWVDVLSCGHNHTYVWRHAKAKTPYAKVRRCMECEALEPLKRPGRHPVPIPNIEQVRKDAEHIRGRKGGLRALAKQLKISRGTLYKALDTTLHE